MILRYGFKKKKFCFQNKIVPSYCHVVKKVVNPVALLFVSVK